MTVDDVEREAVLRLFNSGVGLAQIAVVTGWDREKVKSLTRGHKRPQTPDTNSARWCRYCAAHLDGKRSSAKFCCAEHRRTWWQHHRHTHQASTAGGVFEFSCAGCGQIARVYGDRRRKFCSRTCYLRTRFGQSSSGGAKA